MPEQFSMLGLEYMGAAVLLATGARFGTLDPRQAFVWRSIDAGYSWTRISSISHDDPAPYAGGSALIRTEVGAAVWGGFGYRDGAGLENGPAWRLSVDNGASFLIRTTTAAQPTTGTGVFTPPGQLCLTDDGMILSAGNIDEIVGVDYPEIWRGNIKRDFPLKLPARGSGVTVGGGAQGIAVADNEYTYTAEHNAHDFQLPPDEPEQKQRGARELVIQVRGRATNGRLGDFSQIHVHNDPPDMSGTDLTLTPVPGGLLVSWDAFRPGDLDFDHYQVYYGVGANLDPTQFVKHARRSKDQNNVILAGLPDGVPVSCYVVPFDAFGAGIPTAIFTEVTGS